MGLLPPPPRLRDALTEVLTQEVEAVARFIALLENEQDELRAGRVDALETIVAAKTPLVQQLNQLAEERSQLVTAAGYTADRTGVEALLASRSSAELNRAWEQLQTQARQAQQLNELNGQLIAQRLQSTSGALQVLLQRNPSSVVDVYGPNGQKLGATGSRLIDSV